MAVASGAAENALGKADGAAGIAVSAADGVGSSRVAGVHCAHGPSVRPSGRQVWTPNVSPGHTQGVLAPGTQVLTSTATTSRRGGADGQPANNTTQASAAVAEPASGNHGPLRLLR